MGSVEDCDLLPYKTVKDFCKYPSFPTLKRHPVLFNKDRLKPFVRVRHRHRARFTRPLSGKLKFRLQQQTKKEGHREPKAENSDRDSLLVM